MVKRGLKFAIRPSIAISIGSKYKIISTSLFWFSILWIIIMVIHSVIDYQAYLQHPEYSAPFSVNLLSKGITYGIPVIISFILSATFRNKANR